VVALMSVARRLELDRAYIFEHDKSRDRSSTICVNLGPLRLKRLVAFASIRGLSRHSEAAADPFAVVF